MGCLKMNSHLLSTLQLVAGIFSLSTCVSEAQDSEGFQKVSAPGFVAVKIDLQICREQMSVAPAFQDGACALHG